MFKSKNSIGNRLKQIRKELGFSGEELARLLDYNQSGVSRIERGIFKPDRAYVEKFCKQLELSSEVTSALLEATDAFLYSYDRWYWEDAQNFAEKQKSIARREDSSREIRTYEWKVVPGLLQTKEYAEQIIKIASGKMSVANLKATVKARLLRQKILQNNKHSIVIIIHESALDTPILVPTLQVEQLKALNAALVESKAEIRVVPIGQVWKAFSTDSFTIYDNEMVAIDTHTMQLKLYEKDDVGLYSQLFADLVAQSVTGASAKAIIEARISQLQRR